MYFYSFVMAFPEGIDWTVELAHQTCRLDTNEFHTFCEKALLEFCKSGKRTDCSIKGVLSSPEAADFILNYMVNEFGFVRVEQTAIFCIDPFWGEASIKNPELRALIFDKVKTDDLTFSKEEEEEEDAYKP